ncbi:MAG: aldo/keto reductase [Planctomycetes bacterium]|nr:aldo/keto reductase [Planctomycetota bacterium]
MKTRPLGNTGYDVSVLSFGAAPLGGAYGSVDIEDATRAVAFAIDRGINFFDCSPYYGETLAEERLGKALEGRRDEVVLMTKCGRYREHEFDFSSQRVNASIDESLRRLRTDHLDVFLAHDVEFGDVEQVVSETIPALRELVRSGKTRAIGISGLPVTHLRTIAERAPVDVVLTYCRANLLDHGAIRILTPYCREHGIGLINASPLHMGILRGRSAPDWHPAPPSIHRVAPRLDAICKEHGTRLSTVALAYAVGLSGVDTTLCGMMTVDEVDSNLAAIQSEPSPELLAALQHEIGDLADATWLQGRPENSLGVGEAKYLPPSA